MTRDTYDVAEPDTPDDTPADGPRCPRCGGGPLAHLDLPDGATVIACESCAQVLGRVTGP